MLIFSVPENDAVAILHNGISISVRINGIETLLRFEDGDIILGETGEENRHPIVDAHLGEDGLVLFVCGCVKVATECAQEVTA